MRILHISDTHGTFPELRFEADVVVHSGDLLPNRTRGIRPVEEQFQALWIKHNADRVKEMYGDRKVLICPGNHDFINPTRLLRACGVDAIDIEDKTVDIDGVGFRGFPWVPYFTGEWNYEQTPRALQVRVHELEEHVNVGTVDVLVAHGPIFGVLDRNGHKEMCGSVQMRDMLTVARHLPKAYLCGHIHESAGTSYFRSVHVSNAAVTQNLVVIP